MSRAPSFQTNFAFGVVLLVTFVCIGLWMSRGTDKGATMLTLQKAGYSQITTGDSDAFACGGEYWFTTKFEATNPVGNEVDGVVCCGFLANCVITF